MIPCLDHRRHPFITPTPTRCPSTNQGSQIHRRHLKPKIETRHWIAFGPNQLTKLLIRLICGRFEQALIQKSLALFRWDSLNQYRANISCRESMLQIQMDDEYIDYIVSQQLIDVLFLDRNVVVCSGGGMDVFRCLFYKALFFATGKLKLGPQSFLYSYTRNFSPSLFPLSM